MSDKPKAERVLKALRTMIVSGEVARLSPQAFKLFVVYAVKYRSRGDHRAWPRLKTLSADTGVRETAVREARRELCARGYLELIRRGGHGQPSKFRVRLSASDHRRKSDCDSGDAAGDHRRKSEGVTAGNPDPPNQPTNSLQRKDPLLPPHGGSAREGKSARGSFDESTCESIFAAYPKRTGRRPALSAIRRALERIAGRPDPPDDPVGWLLGKVRQYAGSQMVQAGFAKNPARWFNDDCFDDDPAAWARPRAGDENPTRVRNGNPNKYDRAKARTIKAGGPAADVSAKPRQGPVAASTKARADAPEPSEEQALRRRLEDERRERERLIAQLDSDELESYRWRVIERNPTRANAWRKADPRENRGLAVAMVRLIHRDRGICP